MFETIHEQITNWFTAYAYQPMQVYAGVFLFMFLSSFGLPFPEEIVIVSVGITAYLARHPELYPPPHLGAVGVNVWIAAAVGFWAVILSDILIFYIGLTYGRKLLARPWYGRHFPPAILSRIECWMKKYGFWASGIFRFTPVLRFPGHLACGMMGVPVLKFIVIDGTAALLSIPSQILLIGYYGETVLHALKQLKCAIAVAALGIVVLAFMRWLLKYRRAKVLT